MKGKKAKRIRKGVYGDHSLREKVEYKTNPRTGSIESTGRRFYYRHIKAAVQARLLKI